MDYISLLVSGAGVFAGVSLSEYLRANVRPLLRVKSASGVPIKDIDKERARALDSFLSEWSALLPNPHKCQDYIGFRAGLPEAVQQAWDKHVHKGDLEIWASAEDPARSWQVMFQNKARLKRQVKDFYQEPAVREYLRA